MTRRDPYALRATACRLSRPSKPTITTMPQEMLRYIWTFAIRPPRAPWNTFRELGGMVEVVLAINTIIRTCTQFRDSVNKETWLLTTDYIPFIPQRINVIHRYRNDARELLASVISARYMKLYTTEEARLNAPTDAWNDCARMHPEWAVPWRTVRAHVQRPSPNVLR